MRLVLLLAAAAGGVLAYLAADSGEPNIAAGLGLGVVVLFLAATRPRRIPQSEVDRIRNTSDYRYARAELGSLNARRLKRVGRKLTTDFAVQALRDEKWVRSHHTAT